MKAQINLFLQEDNSFNGIHDGQPMEFASMLHKTTENSFEMKVAILMAASAVCTDSGYLEVAKSIQETIVKIFENNN